MSSSNRDYFELRKLPQLFAGLQVSLWGYVQVNKFKYDPLLSFENLKALDSELEVLDIASFDKKQLTHKCQQVLQRLVLEVDYSKKFYENNPHVLQQKVFQNSPMASFLAIYGNQINYLTSVLMSQGYDYQTASYYATNQVYAQVQKQQLQQQLQQQPQQQQFQKNYQYANNYGQGHQGQGYSNNQQAYQNNQGSQQQGHHHKNYQSQGYQGNHQGGYHHQQQHNQQHQQHQHNQHNQHQTGNHYSSNQNTHNHYHNNNHTQKYAQKNSQEYEYSTQPEQTQQKIETQQQQQSVVSTPAVETVKETVKQVTPAPPAPKVEEPVVLEKKKLSIDQIKSLIAKAAADKGLLRKSVNPELLREIEESKKWEKKVETVEVVERGGDKKNYKDRNQKDINKGSKYEQSQDNRGGQFNKGSKINKLPTQTQSNFDIIVGKNENLETKLVKNKLKDKAAEGDFAEQKAKQQESLDKIQHSKREILFNLNRVAPENVKDIFNELIPFATDDEEICYTLVELIIQKAWEQPKYAASYAKLSSYFARIESEKFKFEIEECKGKKNQVFKYILVDKVQHSFDKKDKKEQLKEEQNKQKYARDTKNHILGNVKFIGELIKIKLIPKKTMKYCISQLLNSFLSGYYAFEKKKQTENNFFDYYFQALIEFLENLGEKYEQIDKDDITASQVQNIKNKIKQVCKLEGPTAEIDFERGLTSNDYFTIFNFIDQTILNKVKDGKRLGALLQNLEQRRQKGWKKHNVQSEGPKKLKDLKYDDEASTEQKQKVNLALLDDKMSKLLKKYVEGETKVAENQLNGFYSKYRNDEIFVAYVKYACDDKKDQILKRLEIFNNIILEKLDLKNFKQAWKNAILTVSLLASEYPFAAAVMAKILIAVNKKKALNYKDYFLSFNEDEQEQEYYFNDEVFQKLYEYTEKSSEIKDLIDPKKKLTHVL